MRRFARLFDRTPRWEAFIAPARERPQLWRLILALVLIAAAAFGSGAALALGGLALGMGERALRQFLMLNTPTGAYVTLGAFIFWWGGLWLAARLIHRRPFATLYGPARRIDWRRYAFGAGLAIGASLAFTLATALIFEAPSVVPRPAWVWALTALAALPVLFIQTGAEELLFRAYLPQQLAARFRSAWIWAVGPSLLFGLLHWNPLAYGGVAPWVLLVTALTGFGLMLVTVRTGELSLAMGLHFGLNAQALLFVSNGRFGTGLAYARWPADETALSALVLVDLVWIGGAFFIAAWWFSRDRPAG